MLKETSRVVDIINTRLLYKWHETLLQVLARAFLRSRENVVLFQPQVFRGGRGAEESLESVSDLV